MTDAASLVVPSISLLEVYRHVLRHQGRDEALRAATAMRQGQVIDLDAFLALQSAELGVEHRLPLADSVVYATAQVRGSTVWTQDVDFKGLMGVEYRVKR